MPESGWKGLAPVQVTRRRFEQLVREALDALPEALLEGAENVAVLIDDWPNPDQRAAHGTELLGLYEGVALTDRSFAGLAPLPDRITVFRGPLALVCDDEEELFEQIRVTLVHEFGHHFGIDDDRLGELGWE